jgi:hypothetical protein
LDLYPLHPSGSLFFDPNLISGAFSGALSGNIPGASSSYSKNNFNKFEISLSKKGNQGVMDNKLIQRYNEIELEFEALRKMVRQNVDLMLVQEQVAELEAKQADLKKTLLHLIALSKLRDEAWRTLSYGVSSYR